MGDGMQLSEQGMNNLNRMEQMLAASMNGNGNHAPADGEGNSVYCPLSGCFVVLSELHFNRVILKLTKRDFYATILM